MLYEKVRRPREKQEDTHIACRQYQTDDSEIHHWHIGTHNVAEKNA